MQGRFMSPPSVHLLFLATPYFYVSPHNQQATTKILFKFLCNKADGAPTIDNEFTHCQVYDAEQCSTYPARAACKWGLASVYANLNVYTQVGSLYQYLMC